MKVLSKILPIFFTILLVSACNEWIDEISSVDPGPDLSAPVVNIEYPVEGTAIQSPELIASVNIQFEATDDIELASISVMIDGVEITSYDDFIDYRRAVIEYLYDQLTSGTHTLTITATDLEGKTTTAEVHFEKKPPYTPIYAGETFYMPFDGDFVEKVSFTTATVVGTPGFSGEPLRGLNAYKGATDGYITFPSAGLVGDQFSFEFWYKLNAVPDRAGILVISPDAEDRNFGLRLAREADGPKQKFFLNVGDGSTEGWFVPSSFEVPSDWMHLAVTVSGTKVSFYINGNLVSGGDFGAVNWTGCDIISIGSGAPRFVYWDHKSDLSYMDELRMFNRELSQAEIQAIIEADKPYIPKYEGEIFYMPFEGNFKDINSGEDAVEVGTPGFATGKVGQAYAGETDSYLEFPTTGLAESSHFSAVFWMNVNADPDRAGILVASPEDTENANYPDIQNKRTNGFRFFRENSGGLQRFKVNVGVGESESWNDGGLVDPTTGEWVHLAFTVSDEKSVIYINGELALESTLSAPMDWTGCDVLTIMSGVPRFTEWNHYSDLSLMDELRLFNKALTQEEVQAIIADEE